MQVLHRKEDCTALCECTYTDAVGSRELGCRDTSQSCTCSACEILQTADQDDRWIGLLQSFPARLAADIAPLQDVGEGQNITGRKLRQMETIALLQDNVDTLSMVQDAIVVQVPLSTPNQQIASI